MHVVITGANRGIGLEMANRYRAAGHEVTGTARDGSADAILDVTDPQSHADLAASFGGKLVDLLICNAGVYLDKGQDLDDGFAADLWARTFAANVTGVFLTVQSLLPNLRSAKGRIGIISSTMASQTRAPGGSYIYRSSKAAVLNLGRNLATDLRADGIAVGIYHPGWVITDMGGAEAAITVEQSASGLIERFADLSIDTTGCFKNWNGSDHVF